MTERQEKYKAKPATPVAVKLPDHFRNAGVNLVRFYRGGESDRWTAAFFATQIVGRYEKGATRELADELAVSPDTIEALARAAIVYTELKHFFRPSLAPVSEPRNQEKYTDGMGSSCFRVVSELREKLTVSHFAEAGRLEKSHDLSQLDVFAMLQQAAEYPRTAVNKMAELVDGENGEDKPTTWEGQARRVYASLLNISTNGAAPTWLARLATTWADTLKVAAKKNEKVEL